MLIDVWPQYDYADFGILSNILLKGSVGRSPEVLADSTADRLLTCTGRRVKHFSRFTRALHGR
jgi:hypothetical protein